MDIIESSLSSIVIKEINNKKRQYNYTYYSYYFNPNYYCNFIYDNNFFYNKYFTM